MFGDKHFGASAEGLAGKALGIVCALVPAAAGAASVFLTAPVIGDVLAVGAAGTSVIVLVTLSFRAKHLSLR